MLDFDERDLVEFAELAGFREVHLDLEANIKPKTKGMDWDTFLRSAGNPKIPTLAEAIREALTSPEKEAFIAHLRPLVEFKQGIDQSAVAYLWAVR
jgi:arsenite methyltransferase